MTNLQEEHAALQEELLSVKAENLQLKNQLLEKDILLDQKDQNNATVVSENQNLKAELTHERRRGLSSFAQELDQRKKRLQASYTLNRNI